MNKISVKGMFSWNYILIISVFYTAFILPVFPHVWGPSPSKIGFTLIYIAAIFSLEKKFKLMLYIAIIALVLEWVTFLLDVEFLSEASRAVNVIFFFLVVFSLIRQIALAKNVNSTVIMQSISGYILLRIVFSVIVSAIIMRDPESYNIAQVGNTASSGGRYLSESFYYGFITLGTLGYGDFVPLKPLTRSLATLIMVTGQLYIAIIIAMLVGKLAASGNAPIK